VRSNACTLSLWVEVDRALWGHVKELEAEVSALEIIIIRYNGNNAMQKSLSFLF
jgi:hypothetical protein